MVNAAANPSYWRPFKSWISFDIPRPELNTPRLVTYDQIGKLAQKIYQQLYVQEAIKLPQPPSSFNSAVLPSSSSLNFTPSIGRKRPFVFVSGFYYSESDVKDPYSTKPVFSHGVLYNIPAGHMSFKNPKAEVLQDVKDLKEIIDAAVNDAVNGEYDYTIDKIDYLGLIFGLGGVHFPR